MHSFPFSVLSKVLCCANYENALMSRFSYSMEGYFFCGIQTVGCVPQSLYCEHHTQGYFGTEGSDLKFVPKSHSDEIRIQCKFLHTFDPLEACSIPFYTADFQNCRVREKSGSCLCASYSPQLKKSIWMKGITDQDKTYQVIPLSEDSKYTVTCTYTHTEACAWTHTQIYHGATWRSGEDYKVWQSYFVL